MKKQQSQSALSEPAKLLLLTSLLSKDHIISRNGGAFLKELILRRDPRLGSLMKLFESSSDFNMGDGSFLEQIHDLILEEAQSFYDDLFADTSLEVGKTLSKDERDRKKLGAEKSLIYGEVEFNSFYRVLRKINPAPGLKFYDLGSGTGKAVFVARLTHDFSKCVGIEILSSLHNQAAKVVSRFNSDFKQFLSLSVPQGVAVYEGSFLDFDWSDGDVVFANSTCFDDELMIDMSEKATKLKAGAIVVTFTKGLSVPVYDRTSAVQEKQSRYKFELLERKRYRMSWGPATVFIHRRLSDDGKPLPPYRLNVLPSDAITYEEEVSKSTYGADSDLYPPPNVTVTKQPSPQYSASKYDYMDDEDDDDDDDDDADGDDEEDDDEDDDEENDDDEEDDQAAESVPLEENDFGQRSKYYSRSEEDDDEDANPVNISRSSAADEVEVEDVEDDDDDEALEDLKDLNVSNGHNISSNSSNTTNDKSNGSANNGASKASPNKDVNITPTRVSPGKSSSVDSPSSADFFSPGRTPLQKTQSSSAAFRSPSSQNTATTAPTSSLNASATKSPSGYKFNSPGNRFASSSSPALQMSLVESDFSFASLTSPQDSDLLRRKRAAPKRSVPIPPISLRRDDDDDDDEGN